MPDVVILTPGNSMCAEYVQSLVNTMNVMNDQGISHKWGNSQGSLVGWVRNRVYEQARELEFSKLVWIDSDISWSVEAFAALVDHDKDIVSGLYLNSNREPVGQPRNYETKLMLQEMVEMEWVGFGFLCMSKAVVDALAEPFIRDGEYGEDVAFSFNARDAGFDMWLDPRIRVTHHKTVPLIP